MAASRFRLVAGIAAAAASVALAVGAGGAQGRVSTHTTTYPSINVNYTDQCTFTITNDEGQPVTQIMPGTYQVNVNTPTAFSNINVTGDAANDYTACKGFVQFQLTGQGVNLATTLDDGDIDTQTLPATFAPSSTFVAVDNNDPSATRTTFYTFDENMPPSPTVTNQCPGGDSCSSPIHVALSPLHRLGATLSANGTATLLTPTGKHALNIPQGNAAITVKDSDAKATFVIQENGSPPISLTPAKFVGHKTVEVLFTPGIWKYYASPRGTEHTFVVVVG